MTRRSLIAAGAALGLWVAPIGAVGAQASCDDWNTKQFFSNAEAADVPRCLAAGAVLEAGGELNQTPLHWAAAYSVRPGVIAALLSAGAQLEFRTSNGWTPLLVAAAFSKTAAVVTTLANAGADLEARDKYGKTPLQMAAYRRKTPNVVAA